mgnify:CR=1 FL=1
MNRLLISETMDPDGAMYRWCSPDVESLGWDVLRIPTQELIHHLGIEAYNAFLRSLIRYWRPHVFMVHPPYDYLIEGTVNASKKVGTRLVAYGFDDPLFLDALSEKNQLEGWVNDIEASFDLYASTSSQSVDILQRTGMDRAVLTPFATNPQPFALGSSGVPAVTHLQESVVIVGRPHDKRLALVEELLEHGIAVSVFGHGWSGVGETPDGLTIHGPLTREAMNSVYHHAGVVITTGDWEDIHVPMVKYRLLEVAMVGGFQIAQACDDLRDYFPETVVPAYESASDLAEKIRHYLETPERRHTMAKTAQEHALRNHRWSLRFPTLMENLKSADRPIRDDVVETSPAGYRSMLMFLGHQEEERGSRRLAYELFSEVVRRFPGDVAARHGKARYEDHIDAHATAATDLEAAIDALKTSDPITARGVFMSYPRGSRPLGLGETGYLHPQAELRARLLLALTQNAQGSEAIALIEAMDDPDLVVAVAAILTIPRKPVDPTVWLALLERALNASPTHLLRTLRDERDNWLKECTRLRSQISETP